MHGVLEKVYDGGHLTQDESGELFRMIVRGELDEFNIAALLIALRAKGEQPDEIAGAARALRESAERFPRPGYACADTCGTGGDGANTINISTAVALVAAEMGIPVVKHGNRSVSSRCGSADVLERLGVKIDAPPGVARRCLDEAGLCFLFAPLYHKGLRFAMPVRRALGTRTIFNVLGPLVNPARPAVQVMGVYDPSLCAPLARTLGLLGCEAALVVHGSGLDEIALHGATTAALYRGGALDQFEIWPEQAGLPRFPLEAIRGGEPDRNASKIAALLGGEGEEAHVAAVAMNAGALAWVFGTAGSLESGASLALDAIQSGRCRERLELLGEISHGA